MIRNTLFLLSVLSLSVQGQSTLGRATKDKDVVAHLFGWPWESIEKECPKLASIGYGYVQTSTAVEHIVGDAWWTDYQPVSYKIVGKRGNRAQFISMVETCKDAGVDVLVDVILNHMTGQSSTQQQTGFDGTQFTKYSYPLYGPDDFHSCHTEINDYSSATNVQDCELSNLSDLDQSRPNVQTNLAELLNDLVSVGVAGFRVDAAKHIDDAQLLSVFSKVNGTFLAMQEVYAGSNQPASIQPSAYLDSGKVIEFRATSNVLDRFKSSGISSFINPSPMGEEWGFIPSDHANFIMANQDTERQGTSLNYKDPNYVLGAIFLLAYDYGQPTVYSSYNYTNQDLAPAQDSQGMTLPVECNENGWRCEHRWDAISRMVGFHNAVKSEAIENVATGSKNQLAFSRGDAGFIALNNDQDTWEKEFQTGLPGGEYCDIIHSNTDSCTSKYTVKDDGTVTLKVGSIDAIAIYANSGSTSPPAESPSSSAESETPAQSSPTAVETSVEYTSTTAKSTKTTSTKTTSKSSATPPATYSSGAGSTRPWKGRNFRFLPVHRANAV